MFVGGTSRFALPSKAIVNSYRRDQQLPSPPPTLSSPLFTPSQTSLPSSTSPAESSTAKSSTSLGHWCLTCLANAPLLLGRFGRLGEGGDQVDSGLRECSYGRE